MGRANTNLHPDFSLLRCAVDGEFFSWENKTSSRNVEAGSSKSVTSLKERPDLGVRRSFN